MLAHRPALRPLGRLPAALLCAAAVAVGGLGCWHDWDDYEASESGGGAPPSSPALCGTLCTAYDYCIGPRPECRSECDAQITACAPAELSTIEACVAELADCDYPPVAPAVFRACLVTVACYSPP